MKIGVCWGPDNQHPILGLDYFEGTVADLLCPLKDDAAFAARLAAVKAAPVRVLAANCFIPGDLKTTGPAVEKDKLDEYVATTMKRALQMGLTHIVFGSGGSRRVPEGFELAAAQKQIVDHLRRWGPIAGKYHVTIVLEPLNKAECNIVTNVDEGADLVRRAGHPNIRLLIDTYHMAKDNDPIESIVRAKGLIAHAHCAEANGRGPLGTTGEDQRPYFRALREIGYSGAISIEANWKDFAAQLPPAVAELRRQLESD